MQINTKFNINQKVFCVDKERKIIKKPCNICSDKRMVTLKGKNYKCPECSGKGCGEYRDVYVVHEATITKIKINIQNDTVQIYYRCIYDRDADLPLKKKHKETAVPEYKNMIFVTMEDAEQRCKELMETECSFKE